MILYCADHDVQFDTDVDTETHRYCHDTSGRIFVDKRREQRRRHEAIRRQQRAMRDDVFYGFYPDSE